MIDKLSLYDFLAALVPGVLLVTAAAVLFPEIGPAVAAGLPGEFAFVALLAGSLVAGLLIQTLGSAVEPVVFWVFRGRPSDRALRGTLGERYLPQDAAARIAGVLRTRLGPTASDRSVFLSAMVSAESAEDSRARTFNAQYGYHRSIFTLSLSLIPLLAWSRFDGQAAKWSHERLWVSVAALVLLTSIFAWRTWQRGAYWVREVLLTAERHALTDNNGAAPSKTESEKPHRKKANS
jgi:hypothetical protein